jgi:amino acid efflux transporter
MALAVGEGARPATAFVALLLTIGAMNAYFAGAAKLGSALGRDGALPYWLAEGSRAGEVPRRSLLVVTVLAGLTLGFAALTGLDFDVFMILATGAFGVVYVLGTAAAVKLFPPGWTSTGAIIGLVTAIGLAASLGWAMVWAGVVSAAAVTYQLLSTRRRIP